MKKSQVYTQVLQRYLNLIRQGSQKRQEIKLSLPQEESPTSEEKSPKVRDHIFQEVIDHLLASQTKKAQIFSKLTERPVHLCSLG